MVHAQKIMRILRESRDYSQEYVANILNINQKTYSNLESGKTKLTLDRIQQLAEFYHVKPDYFLSKDLPVINYNSGPNSHGGVFEVYNNDSCKEEIMVEIYEKMLSDKNKQIIYLENQVEKLTSIIKDLSKKS